MHLFEHYAPLISIFLTGLASVQTLEKKSFLYKVPNIWNNLSILVR